MTKVLVVSDSSSLILGTKAGLLDIICKEFAVQIPKKVFEETVIEGKKLQKVDALKIEKAVEDKRISVKIVGQPKNNRLNKWADQLNLHEGEKEAIQLYIQENARLLLADDRQAINAAKLLEINWATIPDLIVFFAKKKKIKLQDALDSLSTAQTEGRYKLDFVLEAFNEIQKIKGGKK
ncbi:MAG: hypothetical protein ABIJ74_00090 [archaeon]